VKAGPLLERYGRGVAEHRGVATALLVVLTGLAILGIGLRLQEGTPVDFTPQAMFMGEGGAWDRVKVYEQEFGAEDNDVMLILQGELDTPGGIAAIRAIHTAVARVPEVERVDSLANAMLATGDGAGLIEVREAIQPGDTPLHLAAADPLMGRLLLSEDQTVTTLRVRIGTHIQKIALLAPVVQQIVSEAQSVDLPAGMSLHPTGVPLVRTEVVQMMQDDQSLYFPLLTGLFGITIVLLFRRFWLGMTPLLGVLFGCIWAMGVLLSTGAVLNILSVLTPTLVLVIGAADGIHMVSRYREEIAADGDRTAALGRTLRQMTLACFLTTFTTAAGFASLMVADTAVIRDFGLQCCIAVGVTFFAVILAVPTMLAWIPVERVGRPAQARDGRFYVALDALVARRPLGVMVFSLTIVLAAAWLGRGVQTNSRLLEMYTPDHPTWSAIKLAEQSTGGVIPVFIHLSGAPDQMLEPEILGKIKALEDAARAEQMTGWTASPATWVGQLHQLLTGEPGLPTSRAMAAQELLLAQMSGELPIDRVLSADHARARILMINKDTGGREYLRVKHALEAQAEVLFAGTGVVVDITGDGMLAADGVNTLITDLLYSLGLIFGVIALTMLALLRDLKLALIALLPNLVPLVFIMATLGLMGSELQTSNIISFTVAVGMAVDDTIHFIVRYREERKAGRDNTTAIRHTFHGAGQAIVVTSMLLVLGFSVLATSSLTSTRDFGILASVTMTAALLGDLLLLPAMLHLFAGGRRRPRGTA
jgi:predicted RND superfamily exporter protein